MMRCHISSFLLELEKRDECKDDEDDLSVHQIIMLNLN